MEKETKKTTKKPAAKTVTKSAPKATAKKAVASKAPKSTPKKDGGFYIIETGGKQYKIAPGDTITIEKLAGENKAGDKIIFDKVLLAHDGKTTKIGTPYLSGEKVEGVFEQEGKAKKITVIRYKSKSRYRKKYGHRQPFAKVTIK